MYSRVETITPQIAEEYLTHNEGNRNIRYSVANMYARDMKNGKWELTPQGISFYEDGRLADGQHRLIAVIKSGCSVDFNVTYDVPVKTKVLDRGIVRKEADILHFGGFDRNVANNTCVSIVNALFANVSKKPTIQIISDFMEKNQENVYKASLLIQRGNNKSCICKKAPIGAATFCALYCGMDEDGIAEFFTVANTGFYEKKSQTSAIVLRNYIMQEYTGSNTKERHDLFKYTCTGIKDYANNVPRTRRYLSEKEPPFWAYVKQQMIDPYIFSFVEK